MNVRPDLFLSGDQSPKTCDHCSLSGRPIMDVHIGFRDRLFALLQSVDD
jgi:hypothetical protein